MKRVTPKSTRVVLKRILNNKNGVDYLSWVKCSLILLSLFLREIKFWSLASWDMAIVLDNRWSSGMVACKKSVQWTHLVYKKGRLCFLKHWGQEDKEATDSNLVTPFAFPESAKSLGRYVLPSVFNTHPSLSNSLNPTLNCPDSKAPGKPPWPLTSLPGRRSPPMSACAEDTSAAGPRTSVLPGAPWGQGSVCTVTHHYDVRHMQSWLSVNGWWISWLFRS